ncbi:MAG: hypothetical protein AAB421_04295 [Patescibacteria group bacterium]
MTPYRVNWITALIFTIFFLLISGYAYFEARTIVYGPKINLGQLPNTSLLVTEQLIAIRGVAANIVELRMNGRSIPTTEAGAFEEVHLLAPGYNAIVLSATDKLGRTTKEVLEVVYQAPIGIQNTTSYTPNKANE